MRSFLCALAISFCAAACASCGSSPQAPPLSAAPPAAALASAAPCSLALAESWPVATALDHSGIPDARTVWPAMIEKAQRSIDVGEFYVSASGTGALEPTLAALQSAAARGVRVRVLLDAKLAPQYASSIDRLRGLGAVEVVVCDAEAALGGVHHAKYMVIDREQLFVGSQNLDDRSLENIEELGIGGLCRPMAESLAEVFEGDWYAAQGAIDEPPPSRIAPWAREVQLDNGGDCDAHSEPAWAHTAAGRVGSRRARTDRGWGPRISEYPDADLSPAVP